MDCQSIHDPLEDLRFVPRGSKINDSSKNDVPRARRNDGMISQVEFTI